MAISQQIKNQHLLWRAGFGIDVTNIGALAAAKAKHLYVALEKASVQTPEYFDVADNSIKGIFAGIDDIKKMQELSKNGLDNETKKKIRQQSQQDIKSLNIKWVDEMVNGSNPFQEKMALFWHGHFACRDINIFFQQKLLQEIRSNALGNFGDLLKAVSKSASMLSFLNNQQNKKQHPNENFAREVMELFTLGRGNYTEEDIKEAARAFTGWGFNLSGEFQFRKFQHADGTKTILGKTGNFTGDDVLDILLEQKQTAKYITQKMYKYFVNDDIDKDKVEWLSKRFYQSNYNIAELMKDIFTSDWFYSEKNIGSKIKSPIELLVGIRKLLPMQLERPEIQLLLQRALGQLLFYPPNVAGWSGGKNWIDSSSLMIRLQIPRLIKDDDEFTLTAKADDDQQMGMKEMALKKMENVGSNKFKINANVDWEAYIKRFESIKREDLLDAIKQTTLQQFQSSISNNLIEGELDKSSRDAYIKSATVALMSTPEYQMC